MNDDPRRARFRAVADEVYEPLQRYLRRRCAPDVVDDVLNDVLLVVWRRLDDAPADRCLPWCYGIARRCLANQRRSATRRLRLVQHASALASTTVDAPQWTGAADADLHDALATLPDLDRELVRLWAWERLEPREIALVLELTPNAVSLRLARIRTRLENQLGRQNGAPAGHKPIERHRELEP